MKTSFLLVVLTCVALAVSGSFAKASSDIQHVDTASGSDCEICQWAVSEVKDILAQNASKTVVLAALEDACNVLPASVSQEVGYSILYVLM